MSQFFYNQRENLVNDAIGVSLEIGNFCLAVSHLGYPIKVKPLKMPYSAGVHPIAIGKSVQKTGLPYNNSLYPN